MVTSCGFAPNCLAWKGIVVVCNWVVKGRRRRPRCDGLDGRRHCLEGRHRSPSQTVACGCHFPQREHERGEHPHCSPMATTNQTHSLDRARAPRWRVRAPSTDVRLALILGSQAVGRLTRQGGVRVRRPSLSGTDLELRGRLGPLWQLTASSGRRRTRLRELLLPPGAPRRTDLFLRGAPCVGRVRELTSGVQCRPRASNDSFQQVTRMGAVSNR